MTEQTQPTDAEIDVMVAAYLGDCGPQATRVYSFSRAVLAKWGTPAGAGEVVGWMWQHEETGRTGFVDCWQVENGWQENNPRLRLVSKLFTTPQPTQAQAGADAVVEEVAKGLRRYGLTLVKTASGYDVLSLRDIAANGTKGADHG